MKPLLSAAFLLMVFVRCNTSSKESDSNDSSFVAVDTSTFDMDTGENFQAPPPYPEEPTGNFLSLSLEPLSEDPLEGFLDSSLMSLVERYSNQDYLTVQAQTSHVWEYDGEYDKISESADEEKTWYYDSTYHLRCFTRSYGSEGGEGSTTSYQLYLFFDDLPIAIYESKRDDGQIGFISERKILTSHCPACGTYITEEAGFSAQVNYLGEEEIELFKKGAVDEGSKFIATLQTNMKKMKWSAAEKTYTVEVTNSKGNGFESADTPYATTYTIAKELFDRLISKN